MPSSCKLCKISDISPQGFWHYKLANFLHKPRDIWTDPPILGSDDPHAQSISIEAGFFHSVAFYWACCWFPVLPPLDQFQDPAVEVTEITLHSDSICSACSTPQNWALPTGPPTFVWLLQCLPFLNSAGDCCEYHSSSQNFSIMAHLRARSSNMKVL